MLLVRYNQQDKQRIITTKTDDIFNVFSSMKCIPKQELVFLFNNIYVSPFRSFDLIDIGILPEYNLDLMRFKPKNGYFNIFYYNFLIILPIYKYFNVFDIKKFFSSKLFTVPQNISIIYSNNALHDDQLVYDFNTDENNPFIINVNEGYSLFYTFVGCFNLICLPSNSTFEDLKDSISAYSQRDKYTISINYKYGARILNYFKSSQEKINSSQLLNFQSDIKLFELVESKNVKMQKYEILIEIVSLSKIMKYYSFYFMNIYFVTCLLEKEFQIDRTLFEVYDQNGAKLEKNVSIEPNKNSKLKVAIKSILHIKINEIEKDLNYFTKIEDFKKSLNFDQGNFSIIINNHFVKEDENNYLLIHFLNNSNDSKSGTNIKINYSKSSFHEIILKNQGNGKEIKSLIENTWSLDKIFHKIMNKNIDSFKILKGNSDLIVYENQDHRNIEIIFVDEENVINECCVEVIGIDPRVIDLLYSFYKSRKKKFVKKYVNFEPFFGSKKLTFCEKLSNILYDKENKIKIKCLYNKKNKSKKIIIDDFYHHRKHIIDNDIISSKEIIAKICNKEKYRSDDLVLFMNYVELSINNYPTLYNQEGDMNLILNKVQEKKTFWISNCKLLKIQLNLHKIQYSSIAHIIKKIFNLDDEQKVQFGFKMNDVPYIFKLPENFDAGSIPDNSIIFINYKYLETNQIVFISNSLFKRKKIELSDINQPINSLKREIQCKLNLNEYSLKSIHFSFYQTKFDECKKFSDYKINSLISVNVDESILIKIYIPEKTLYKYFSIGETVKDVKDVLKIQYNIENDFNLNSKNGEILNNNTVLCNKMDIYFNCNKIIIKGNGSLSNQQFEIIDMLLVSEAINYIKRITNEKDISIFIYNKDEDCYVIIDLMKKLSEFKDQLFVHKIITSIDFDDIKISIPRTEQISEMNSIKWFKKNFLSKELLINPQFILLKRGNLYIYENKKIIDVLNDKKGILTIEFHLHENVDDVEKNQQIKCKKRIVKPKITYVDADGNKSNSNKQKSLLQSAKIVVDDKSNIKSEMSQDGLVKENIELNIESVKKTSEFPFVNHHISEQNLTKHTLLQSSAKIDLFNLLGKHTKDEYKNEQKEENNLPGKDLIEKSKETKKPIKKKPKLSAFRPKITPVNQSTKTSKIESLETSGYTTKNISQKESNISKDSETNNTLKDSMIDDTKKDSVIDDTMKDLPDTKKDSIIKDEIENSQELDKVKELIKLIESDKENSFSKSKSSKNIKSSVVINDETDENSDDDDSYDINDDNDDSDDDEEEDKNDDEEAFDISHIPIIDLSEYKVKKRIGEGSFGIAYLIKHRKTKKLYAAKVSKGKINTKQEKKQFFKEIDSQIKANNPSVLKLIGINLRNFNNKKHPTIITEYMVNKSLQTNLDYERKNMRPDELTDTKKYIILLGLALGMKYLFLQGIIHRDLKPDNILLDENFYPYICDFGLSVISDIQFNMSMVKLDEKCGTPLYEAPEIFEGLSYTYKVDVYSFSFIAYELLTGSPLFTNINTYRFQYDIVNGKRPDLSLIHDKEICKFLEKCWSANPNVRPTFNYIVEEIMKERYRNYFNADESEVEEYLDLFDEKLKAFSEESDIAAIYKKRADIGDVRAIFNYGMLLILMSEGNHAKVNEAVKYIKIAADKDFSEAIFRYGVFCVIGFGVPINDEEGARYLKIAANRKYYYAAFMYGTMLRDGDGVPADGENAAKYIKMAADSGIKAANYEYAVMLFTGKKIPQDKEKASIYLKKGADLGEINSMYLLARMLYYGDGIPQNREEAKRYYHEAADNGHVDSKYSYAMMCIEDGDETEGNIYFLRAADKGHDGAFYALGYNFYYGKGCQIDKRRGFSYLKKAADLGNSTAMFTIGVLLEEGDGVGADPLEAKKYYKMAIDKGNVKAMFNLGIRLLEEKELKEAVKYIKMAVDFGNAKAIAFYGEMLFKGNGVPENKEEGLRYVKMAIDKGYTKAQEIYNAMLHPELKQNPSVNIKRLADEGSIDAIFQYAVMLYTGNGIDLNYEESLKYFKMAADKGHIVSAYNYGYMLLQGLGAVVNILEAAKYLKIAADGNFPKALLTYATLLMNGNGIPKNMKGAAHYFHVLANLGDPDGMYGYGTLVLFGIGVPVNEGEGLHYLFEAYKMGIRDAYNKIKQYRDNLLKEIEKIDSLIENADKGDMNAILEIIKMLNEGKKKDFENIQFSKYLIIAINNGNSDAMFLYAEMLFNGDEVVQNKKEAIKYYQMSAEKGNEKAMFLYGKLLFNGVETAVNKPKAVEYFKKCADLDNEEAIALYASILYDGNGIPSNKREAAKYFKKSIENGNLKSMFYYALMLFNGDEIPQNTEEASKYFRICADNGNQEAASTYANMLLNGIGITADEKEASKYFKISADFGNVDSMLQYANLTNDDAEKAKYYKMSIDNGNKDAILKYGDYLAIEWKLSRVNREDINYLKMAADLGHPEASLKYGYILQHGIGIRANKEEGAKYIKSAVDKDVKDAYLAYANILHKGEGVPKNSKEAAKYFKLAISKGDESIAAFDYAEILYKGDGVEEDKKLAAHYYKMAAKKGNSAAMNKYGEMLKYGDGIDMNREEGERYIKLAVDNEEQLRKNYQFVGNMLELLFPGCKCKMQDKYPGLFD